MDHANHAQDEQMEFLTHPDRQNNETNTTAVAKIIGYYK
jgi:hypothetical protein